MKPKCFYAVLLAVFVLCMMTSAVAGTFDIEVNGNETHTLNDQTIEGEHYALNIKGTGSLTLILVGDNVLCAESGIFSEVPLTIDGSGTLQVTATTNEGIITTGDLTISAGTGKIEVISEGSSYGIYTDGRLNIHSPNLSVTSNVGQSVYAGNGIFCSDAVVPADSSDGDNWYKCVCFDFCMNSYFKSFEKMTVTFDPGNGVGTMASQTGMMGVPLTVNLPVSTFTPPEGYKFKAWSVNGEEKAPGAQIVASENVIVTALYQKESYTVAAKADPVQGGSVRGIVETDYDETFTLTAEPERGYSFKGWQVNGAPVSTEATYTFTVNGNMDILALFALEEYEVIVSAEQGGSAQGGGMYNYGAAVTLTATPDDGYSFAGWYVNNQLVGTDIAYSFTVTENVNISAVFEKIYELPKTGDNSHTNLWLALAFISMLGMMALVCKRKEA